jgi:hypothetical protein
MKLTLATYLRQKGVISDHSINTRITAVLVLGLRHRAIDKVSKTICSGLL